MPAAPPLPTLYLTSLVAVLGSSAAGREIGGNFRELAKGSRRKAGPDGLEPEDAPNRCRGTGTHLASVSRLFYCGCSPPISPDSNSKSPILLPINASLCGHFSPLLFPLSYCTRASPPALKYRLRTSLSAFKRVTVFITSAGMKPINPGSGFMCMQIKARRGGGWPRTRPASQGRRGGGGGGGGEEGVPDSFLGLLKCTMCNDEATYVGTRADDGCPPPETHTQRHTCRLTAALKRRRGLAGAQTAERASERPAGLDSQLRRRGGGGGGGSRRILQPADSASPALGYCSFAG